ncbi:MAG TPA: FG-GAP repeat protein, partial [Thermoanaerobaculia bacterium]|nr:FG-GAP repeat protein [Thermoanaerobaculia bacterium]
MTTTMNRGLVPGSVLPALAALTLTLTVAPAALAQPALVRLQAEDRAGGDLFACALDLDGTTLLVGSLLDDDRGADSGSAYVFELGPGAEGWRQSAKLLAPDAAAGHRFGFAVALAGERALIGAPLAGAGGAVYQYEREPGGEEWRLVARFGAAEGGADAGAALAFTPTRVLAGAPAADAAGRIDAGAVLAFSLDAAGNRAVERIAAREPQAGAGFGGALAAGGGWAAVGAPWTDAPFTDSGAVHLFAESGAGLAETVRITAADGRPFDAFG